MKTYNLEYGFNIKITKNFKIFSLFFIPILIKFNFSDELKNKIKFYLSPKKELAKWYKRRTGDNLNIDNPQTFNEKIQWMKIYDSNPTKTLLADKYLVRDWVKNKIGEEHLIKLLGVWDKFDDIDFDKLPEQFVLKCNHGCGYNIIVRDKSNLNIKDTKNKLETWLKEDFAFKNGFEMHYSKIPRKIIAEEYIPEVDKSAIDYKFICFNGEPFLCWITDKSLKKYERMFYKLPEWEPQDIEYLDGWAILAKNPIQKPKQLDKIIEICKTLSKGFPLVRVDLYVTDEKILFGEMTFTTSSGRAKFSPDKWNYILGEKIILPKK